MDRVFQYFLSLSLLFSTMTLTATAPQSKGWRGIVPLQSTRAQVELILGRPTKEAAHNAFYALESEVVTVWYASAACGSENSSGWNVPPGTVIQISVSPKRVMKLAELQLDLSTFTREANEHFPDDSFYRNDKEGMGVVTIRDVVRAVSYYPSENQNHLRCVREEKKKPRESSATELTAEEKAMIDRFMTCLKQQLDSSGWIRVDVGKRHAHDADLAELVFRYLEEKYPSEIKRISIMGGASYLSKEIEFFLIPPDGKPIPFLP